MFSLFSFISKSSQEPPIILQDFAQENKQILVTLSVRTAFDLLLQSLNLPTGSEVLMSAVNIRDMVEIIKLHGLVPVPIDIDLDTLEPDIELLEKLISPKSKVFLVAHLFGAIVNLEPIIKVCQKHNLLLVEDCAQAFCGNRYCGDRQADVSLFSFGPIKSCTALGGAIACIGDRTIAEKMTAILAQYPSRNNFWFFKRVIKYFCLKLLSIPWIYFYLMSALKLLGFELDSTINSLTRGFSKGDLFSKIRYLPPQKMIDLLWHRLKTYDNYWFKNRESKARLFISLLSPKISYPGNKASFHSFWLVPILTDNPESSIAKLRQNGFDATRGNTSLIHTSDRHYLESQKPTLTPQHLNDRIVYLPISDYLPEKSVIDLANLVNQFI